MRTLFLLDRADLAALRSGEPFDLQVGGSMITLQAEQPAKKTPGPAAEKATSPQRRRAHSRQFKAKVARYAKGKGGATAARTFGVSHSLVSKWMREQAAAA